MSIKIRNKYVKALKLDFGYSKYNIQEVKENINFLNEIKQFVKPRGARINHVANEAMVAIERDDVNKGGLLINVGDFLIKNVDGDISVCEAKDFNKLYEIIPHNSL